jgi:hypothetical protein
LNAWGVYGVFERNEARFFIFQEDAEARREREGAIGKRVWRASGVMMGASVRDANERRDATG